MRCTPALGRQRWSACSSARRSRKGRRRRISQGRVCWTPRSWISSTCHYSVRNCSAIRWRVSINQPRTASRSVEVRHHRRHHHRCHCYCRRRRSSHDDARAPPSTSQLPPGLTTTFQCVVSDGASSRFTSRGLQRAKWRRSMDHNRPPEVRRLRRLPRCRSMHPPDETLTLEGATIITIS